MSDGKMTYEDWLRGCVYHDGRQGYVTLPCDEVLKIADFIERLRADRKTETQTECTGCRFVGTYDTQFPCANCARKTKDYYDSPQTERSK